MKLKTEAELDADALRDHAGEIVGKRRFAAVLWGFVFAFALASSVLHDGRGMFLSFLAAVVASFLTIAMSKLTRDERLVRPLAYRGVAWILLAVALFGIGLAFVPHTSEASQLVAVYFGIIAFFCYRSVVTRGSRAALYTVVMGMWVWLPIGFLAAIGNHGGREHRYERIPAWTEVVSLQLLHAFLLLLPILALVALISFTPRRDAMPDARVVSR